MATKSKNKHKKSTRVIKVATNCYFCNNHKDPSYLEVDELGQFMTDRAKIIGIDFSGLCAKHQRKLSVAVKRARHLSLLPFRPQI